MRCPGGDPAGQLRAGQRSRNRRHDLRQEHVTVLAAAQPVATLVRQDGAGRGNVTRTMPCTSAAIFATAPSVLDAISASPGPGSGSNAAGQGSEAWSPSGASYSLHWPPAARAGHCCILPFVLVATFVLVRVLPRHDAGASIAVFALAGLGCPALLLRA